MRPTEESARSAELLVLQLKDFALVRQWLDRFAKDALNALRRNKNLHRGENLGICIRLSRATDAGLDIALVVGGLHEDTSHQTVHSWLEP